MAMAMAVLVGAVCGGVVLAAVVLRRVNEWLYVPWSMAAGLRLPPGSLGWPVIGGTLSFVRLFNKDPDAYFQRHFLSKYKEREGIYKAHLFGSPSIITCGPEMNKFVLAASIEDDTPFSVGWPCNEIVGPNSMMVTNGAQHHRMKRLLVEAVSHPLALEKAIHRLYRRFETTLAEWARLGHMTLRDATKKMTFEDICMVLVSLKPGATIDAMEEYIHSLVKGFRAHPINIPGFSYHEALKGRKEMVKVISSIIEERHRNKNLEKEDFLDVLLDVMDENGNKLTDEEILDNIISFLVAAHESISYTMLWSIILLGKNPRVLSKLRDEHISLHKSGDMISMDDLNRMPYTDNVINEVLRVINISPFVFRKLTTKDVSHKGFLFPKGWKVIVWFRNLHMDPNNFLEPLVFNPDRFEEQKPRPGVFTPFGGGRRYCPGSRLAFHSTRIFLHLLVLNYTWEVTNPNCDVTYLPHPKPVDGGKIFIRPL